MGVEAVEAASINEKVQYLMSREALWLLAHDSENSTHADFASSRRHEMGDWRAGGRVVEAPDLRSLGVRTQMPDQKSVAEVLRPRAMLCFYIVLVIVLVFIPVTLGG